MNIESIGINKIPNCVPESQRTWHERMNANIASAVHNERQAILAKIRDGLKEEGLSLFDEPWGEPDRYGR